MTTSRPGVAWWQRVVGWLRRSKDASVAEVPGCEAVVCRKCGGPTIAPSWTFDSCVHWCNACLCHTRHRTPAWASHSA